MNLRSYSYHKALRGQPGPWCLTLGVDGSTKAILACENEVEALAKGETWMAGGDLGTMSYRETLLAKAYALGYSMGPLSEADNALLHMWADAAAIFNMDVSLADLSDRWYQGVNDKTDRYNEDQSHDYVMGSDDTVEQAAVERCNEER